jgi:ABC-type antimicrobial peptide transport system permease subunit
VAGLGLGAAGYAATTRLIRSQLFGVARSDPTVIGTTGLILLAITAFAIWVPARRAMRINPTEAHRHDEA